MSSSRNTTVTPLEEAILQNTGNFMLNNFASFTVLTLLYGIFIPLFSTSLYMMIRRGLRTLTNWAALIGTSVSFAVMTVQWIMVLTWLISIFQIFLIHNGNLSLEDREFLQVKEQNHFISPLDNLQTIPLLISDAFVVWRASILFTRKWAMVIPITCLICSIGLDIAAVPISTFAFVSAVLNWALLAFSLATNVISTGMIGWRLWIYRKHVLPKLDDSKSQAHRIIITLIESGAGFCSIQVIGLIVQLASGAASTQNPSITVVVTQQTLFSLAALYPTFIVLICRNQSSRIDQVASLSVSIGTDLRFATTQASQSQSMTD